MIHRRPRTAFYSEPNALELVAQFHHLFRNPVVSSPELPSDDRSNLRISLLREHLLELQTAMEQQNLVQAAAALAGIQHVLSGAVLEFGMGGIFLSLFDEVHRSNMSKACSTLQEAEETQRYYQTTKDTECLIEKQPSDNNFLVFRKTDRKVLKSIRYSPPNLAPIVQAAQQYSSFLLLASPGALSAVAEFHSLFDCPILATPTLPSSERCQLRVNLLQEEIDELHTAVQEQNLVEIADALADIQYVLSGTILELGMGTIFHHLFGEVHRSKMSKAAPEESQETMRYYLHSKQMESHMEQVEPDKQRLLYRRQAGGEEEMAPLDSIRYSPSNLASHLFHVE